MQGCVGCKACLRRRHLAQRCCLSQAQTCYRLKQRGSPEICDAPCLCDSVTLPMSSDPISYVPQVDKLVRLIPRLSERIARDAFALIGIGKVEDRKGTK